MMVCPYCYGKGERGSIEWGAVKICPECQGSGILSCCDTAGANCVVEVSQEPTTEKENVK